MKSLVAVSYAPRNSNGKGLMFCPVCHTLGILGLETLGVPSAFYTNVTDANGTIAKKMLLCGKCHAVFGSDIAFMNKVEDADAQSMVNQTFYAPSTVIDDLDRKTDELYAIIASFERFFTKNELFIELGCGLGLLTRAAGRRFTRAVGLDLEISTARGVAGLPDHVEFVQHDAFVSDRLPEAAIDALAAWHVLEHLPDPHAILGPFLNRIVKGGLFFGQIPLLKQEHVIAAHHIFYRAETLISLCNPYGMAIVYLEKDESNGFLSFCFRRY